MRPCHLFRAVAAVATGIVLATAGCRSSTKPRPGSPELAEALSYFSLGLLADSHGDPETALSYFNKAIRLHPGEQRVYIAAAVTAIRLEDAIAADRIAAAFANAWPRSEQALLLQARVYALTDRPELAEPLFEEATRLFPGSLDAAGARLQFLLSQKRPEEAYQHLTAIADQFPDNSMFLRLAGIIRLEKAQAGTGGDPSIQNSAEAAQWLRRAAAVEPGDASIWQQLALALSLSGKDEEALDAIRQARRLEPDDLLSARQWLDLLLKTGAYRTALEQCETLAYDTGMEAVVWLHYLPEALPGDRLPLLIEALRQILEEQPDLPTAYPVLLATLLAEQGETESAQHVLQNAMEQHAGNHRLHTALGALFFQQQLYDSAYRELRQARELLLQSAPEADPMLLVQMLTAAQAGGQTTDAADIMAELLKESPDLLDRYVYALLSGELPVQLESSIALLTLFHSQHGETPLSLYSLMALLMEQKRYEESLQAAGRLLERADEAHPELLSEVFHYQYAALHERTGHLEQAATLFHETIVMAEKAGNAQIAAAAKNYLAYMWAERGLHLETGLQLIREALEIDPENGAFIDTLGWIYYQQGRYREALHELYRAIEFTGDDWEILKHLGDTWLQLDNLEKAVDYWRRALEKEPGSDVLQERLRQHAPDPADTGNEPE